MPLAFISERNGLEWADVGLLAALLVAYLLLAIVVPGLVLRPFFWLATRTIYRIRVTGAENVPMTGPVLLLSNHVTFIDWLLVWHACPRKVRFVAWAGWTQEPGLPVVPARSPTRSSSTARAGRSSSSGRSEQITAALDAGEVICLFPEGALSRGRRGDAPVPPRVRTRLVRGQAAGAGRADLLEPAVGEHFQLRRRQGAPQVARAHPVPRVGRVRQAAAANGHRCGGPAGHPGAVGRDGDPGQRIPAADAPAVPPGGRPVLEHAAQSAGSTSPPASRGS